MTKSNSSCTACNAKVRGGKSSIAQQHTCGLEPHYGVWLPDGTHASFSCPPTPEILEAVKEMVRLAKKNLK